MNVPVGWLNSVLPLAGLAALAAGLPELLTPHSTLSQRRLALAVAAAAALVLAAGAGLFAVLYARSGADPWAAFFLARAAQAGLVWLPLLALVWLIKAQAVERRRGEARVRAGTGPRHGAAGSGPRP